MITSAGQAGSLQILETLGTMCGTVVEALAITAIVAVMMLVIEYLNVLTGGSWQDVLARRRVGQYLLAAVLGAIPGCLGAFAIVGLYSHRTITLGAVVTAMVATSGDEAFVMLAMIPDQALILTGILMAVGIAAGALTDVIAKHRGLASLRCEGLQVHVNRDCQCFPRGRLLQQWKNCSAARGILATGIAGFLLALGTGHVGPPEWNWVRVTLTSVAGLALFIVGTVPDHFLEAHLWQHVVRKHVPRVFLWTLGAMTVVHLIESSVLPQQLGREAQWVALLTACLVGLIPESGPHLVFLTLYINGTVPFGVFLASSIVQDGHGMLPLLAHSKRDFVIVKVINLLAGFLIGAVAVSAGV